MPLRMNRYEKHVTERDVRQIIDLLTGQMGDQAVTVQNFLNAVGLQAMGLPGGQVPTRYSGGTTGGPPTDGTWMRGMWVVDIDTPSIWICTTAGSPGTWVQIAAGGAVFAGTYVFEQLTPASSWTINHGLSFWPAVTVVDSGGTEVIGDVNYPNNETVIVSFSYPFSGRAFLN